MYAILECRSTCRSRGAGQERPLWWLSGDTSPVYNLEQDINTAILTRGGALKGLLSEFES
jgi:hypothetical protein